MMSRIGFVFIVVGITFMACDSSDKPQVPKQAAIETTALKSEYLELRSNTRKGYQELKEIEVEKEETLDFPNCDSDKIMVYELNGHPNHDGARSVFRQRTGKQKELEPHEISSFLELIQDKNYYKGVTSACHEPRVGIVFYNSQNKPCSFLSLCLACNNLFTEPRIKFDDSVPLGFSHNARKIIRKFISEWGFPDHSVSYFHDSKDYIRERLRLQGIDSISIERRLEEYESIE